MTEGFLVVNESSTPELTEDALLTALRDIQVALDRDFFPEYGRLSLKVALGARADMRNGLHLTVLVDRCDVPSAVAHHTIDAAGNPVLQIGTETARAQGGNVLDEITKALTHEIMETTEDEYVNACVVVPGVVGKRQMREVCDPCQGGFYREGTTAISNFVTRAYWDPQAANVPFDWLGVLGRPQLSAPLSCAPDGYVPWDDGSADFGELVPDHKRAQIRQHGRVAKLARAA